MDTGIADIARRFPLVARARPACTPLAERVAGLCERARTAQRENNVAEATAVLNLAALLASDLGLPQLARDWCHRHVNAYLKAPELGPDNAHRLLEPLINLARLQVRAGQGEQAVSLMREIYTAVRTRTDTVIDGIALPTSTMTGDEARHQEIRRWLWAVMLATTARALASIGHWTQAHEALVKSNGIGNRMTDGRQIAVLERIAADDIGAALALTHTTEPGEPWEQTVTACLAALCDRSAGSMSNPDVLLDRYLALSRPAELVVFNTRLGLAVIDVLGGPQRRACRGTALILIAEVLERGDGYAARDLLGHTGYVSLMSIGEQRAFTDRVLICGLGQGELREPFDSNLAAALNGAESVIIESTSTT